jgi:hypothetical protein
MRDGIVPELDDPWVPIEHGLDNAPLHAPTAAMNQPDFPEAGSRRLIQVLVNHRRNVAWRECVQIQRRRNRNSEGHGVRSERG